MSLSKIHKVGHWFYRNKLPLLSFICDRAIFIFYNSSVPSGVEIGDKTLFAYGGIGIVIHKNSKIGEHCMIGQGITIGGRGHNRGIPIVENNVYIGPGVRILGSVRVGHDSIIGANSVVLEDVPPYSVVAGVPAKLINSITKESYFLKYKSYYGPLYYEDIKL